MINYSVYLELDLLLDLDGPVGGLGAPGLQPAPVLTPTAGGPGTPTKKTDG